MDGCSNFTINYVECSLLINMTEHYQITMSGLLAHYLNEHWADNGGSGSSPRREALSWMLSYTSPFGLEFV